MRKLYDEWVPILEDKYQVQVYDPDGAREVYRLGKEKELMTQKEAEKYFLMSTVLGSTKSFQ